jgi:outer membrane protein TolC
MLKAEKTREMAQRSLDQSQILLQDVGTKFNQNMASSVDLLRAKQSVENSRINLVQAEKNVQLQKQQMNLLIGRDLQLPLLLEDQFSYKAFPFELDSLTSSVASSRSELKDLQWQREGEELTLKDIQRDRQAKIHLIGSYVEENYKVHLDLSSPDWSLDWRITGQFIDGEESLVNIQNNTDPFTPSSPGWGVGLEVTWVPFDGGISEEKKKQQEIKIAQLERKLNTLPDSLSLEVLDAYDRLLQTDQAVLSAQLEKQIADESYRIQKQQFDAGYITDRTLKESELSLHDAVVKYDKALYEYILAKVQLYQAAGKPILLDDL